jgi:hypothetical protein
LSSGPFRFFYDLRDEEFVGSQLGFGFENKAMSLDLADKTLFAFPGNAG